ncbi:MAG: hypothetical protein DPW09_08760 [Anaerolineae bacterium]|nr:DUF2157 domain-containing protein [Anaerolineales bacterium]MCQ3973519.1 hypothetical protein [Anaerolineae bacterium]
MPCPNCAQPTYDPLQPCPVCQFSGDPALIQELDRIEWLLAEIDTWWAGLGVRPYDLKLIRQKYITRLRELEIALKLRLPPFTPEEARRAWPELFHREALLQKIGEWLAAGLIDPSITQPLVDQTTRQVDDLLEQLEDYPRPDYPQTEADRLDLTNFLLEAAAYLRQNHSFTTPAAETQLLTPLQAEKDLLEINLGLRLAPEPISQPPSESVPDVLLKSEPAQESESAPHISPAPPPPRSPAPPLRDRLWRTLLSERTLQALLFLGIFLLFSAALSFVVWGWKDFSAPLRVAIPAGFTALFFTLGWYVRTKTPLYRSGIALSAIAALLIPIDFYTIYVNFHISPDFWPSFWLITSLICLMAYVGATLIIRSRFFGFLVGVAAGSTALALVQILHQAFGLSLDWRTASLSGLALGLIVLATTLEKQQPTRFASSQLFAEPFRYLSLLTVGVLMPLTFGWRYVGHDAYDTLHFTVTINWWLGGFIFAWGAIHYRSRSLGLLAAIALPVAMYLAQAAVFYHAGVNPAWHGLGLALLTPLYFVAGHKLLARQDDPILHGHGRTATGWGVALLIAAALWSLTDITNGAAAASTHVVLAGAVILAAWLWRQPRTLYAASLFSLSAVTFGMAELDLNISQLGVGWASLAIVHLLVALNLGTRFPNSNNAAHPIVVSGYIIAALALLPPLFPYNGDALAYTLGNWLGLAAWGARLAYQSQPGFTSKSKWGKSIFHWFTAWPLPLWMWLLFANRRPLDFSLPLALAVLAWGLVMLSYRLARANQSYRWPWYLAGLLVSVAAPITAFIIAPAGFTPGLTLLLAGFLYLADAISQRQSLELAPAGPVLAWGYIFALNRLHLSLDAVGFGLSLLIAAYFLAGLWTERRKSPVFTHTFLLPLYLTAHVLTLFLLGQIYLRPVNAVLFDALWTDPMRLWGAAAQLLLALAYSLYAWGTYKERWGHLAVWLAVAAGGFVVINYSHGRGSSAASVALMALVLILLERALFWLRSRQHTDLSHRHQAFFRLTWRLFRRPLLAAGWIVSGEAVGLALVRNLWLLGGGRIQQIWAVVGLLVVVGLYALSARLFRQARFAWLAALLIFAPWTILTNLGWFTSYRPTVPGFALSWVILAWALYLTALALRQFTPAHYIRPSKIVAHVLLPFSLLWGVADVDTSRFTFALAIGLYTLAAVLDHRSLVRYPEEALSPLKKTRFFYPALGLLPVWCVYLLAWLLPQARHEHYGLMLLTFGPLGLIAGQWLKRMAPQPAAASSYALPAYLTGYGSLIVGTMLVAHDTPLLALALLFDALLLLFSARLFKQPLWVYPAAVLAPISLLLALNEASVAGNRQGWWLIGLASIYLALAWTLRRVKLDAYATATLTMGFALVALSLPPSSQDQTGALWGYGAAALLYAITAFWLQQPLLLTPASALAIVPYAMGLQKSALSPEYYGLALFPGALAALMLGWGLDRRLGEYRDFPWGRPGQWLAVLASRFLQWWGLPFYALGFGLAVASPFFTEFRAGLSALNFLLLMPLFGWAIYRFRLRVWLFALFIAGHLAAVYYLQELGWWRYPPWAWYRFLPVTLITAGVALFIERYRQEGSPLSLSWFFKGWSRPLYIIVLFDIICGQVFSLSATSVGMIVTLVHALILATLASFWVSAWLPYVSIALGVVALVQWLSTLKGPIEELPAVLAGLALLYGVIGYGLSWIRQNLPENRTLRSWLVIWELPLQRFSLIFSGGILLLTAWLGLDVVGWTIRAMIGLPFRETVELAIIQMVVRVLSLLGLLYVAAAFTYRRLRWGYAAIGMLLAAWILHAFYVQRWENIQWYAIPAGCYLLAIAYLEWQRGNKVPARWLDYTAMVLLLGSLFWQTLLFGWTYALLLGSEGFSALWWGSARRMRRFLYAGMVAVILATVGQLVNSLRSVNQWIVFGFIGLSLVVIAVLVERKLENIKAWYEVLETWE